MTEYKLTITGVLFTDFEPEKVSEAILESIVKKWHSKSIRIESLGARLEPEVNANARLRAAAPDLLEACLDLLYASPDSTEEDEAYRKIQDAVFRAREGDW